MHPAPIPKFSQKTSSPQFALSCAKFWRSSSINRLWCRRHEFLRVELNAIFLTIHQYHANFLDGRNYFNVCGLLKIVQLPAVSTAAHPGNELAFFYGHERLSRFQRNQILYKASPHHTDPFIKSTLGYISLVSICNSEDETWTYKLVSNLSWSNEWFLCCFIANTRPCGNNLAVLISLW